MKPFIPSDPDPAPMRRLARKYSLLDARALIAATDAGLTTDRVFWSDMHGRDGAVLKHCRELTAAGVIRWRRQPGAGRCGKLERVMRIYECQFMGTSRRS